MDRRGKEAGRPISNRPASRGSKAMDIYRMVVTFSCVIFGSIIIVRSIMMGGSLTPLLLGVALVALGIYRFYLIWKITRGE